MNKNERDEELKSMAPQLQQWQQQSSNGAVPKDYFQNFEARLQRRIAAEQELEPTQPMKQQRFGIWWRQVWKWTLGLALPVAIVLIWWSMASIPKGTTVTSTPTFADLSIEEFNQYLEGNLELFSSQELAIILDEEALNLPDLVEPSTEPVPALAASATQVLDKALEQTKLEHLLDELKAEDFEDMEAEDWL